VANSGKFIFDDSLRQFVCLTDNSHLNIALDDSADPNSFFTIITDEGNKYIFANRETSYSIITNVGGSANTASASPAQTTSWKLSKIINADATDSIVLTYTAENYSYYSEGSNIIYQALQGAARNPVLSYSLNTIQGNAKLTNISGNSFSVDFTDDGVDRQDLFTGGNYALGKITVKNSSNQVQDIFVLHHGYYQRDYVIGATPVSSPSLLLLRRSLRLDSISEYGNSETNPSPLRHAFTYDATQLPGRLSFQKDWWGYPNNNTYTTSLVPPPFINDGLPHPGADRTPYTSKTSAGILTAVRLPTWGITYDYNGNIKTMNQRGVDPGNPTSPIDMDKLSYNYTASTNQLKSVEDIAPSASALPDFKNGASQSTEYTFDANGNMITDANKGCTYQYNIFNKPVTIAVDGKGTITYVYDGVGNLLQKKVSPLNNDPAEKWDYIGDFVYKNDTLQYILNEEGRARPVPTPWGQNDIKTKYVYDYFVKDHLGNVRSTITANPINSNYLAGFEMSQANIEQLVFDNVAPVRDQKPGSTDPDDHMSARLNANDPNTTIGTSIMLKTMPGDRFNISVDALYEGDYQQRDIITGRDIVSGLLTTLTGGINYEGIPTSELPDNVKTIQTIFNNPNLAGQIDQLSSNNNDIAAPKAHLNYLFFDKNMQLVSASSGAVQVGAGVQGWNHLTTAGTGSGSAQPIPICASCVLGTGNEVIAPGGGFLVVYIDNQSIGKDVWFDHFMIEHYTSEVVEEDHYYPFGLTLNIDQNTTVTPNTKKYQGIELEKHFGLETFETPNRDLDPQLGRFNSIDPKADKYYSTTPYASMDNDPAINVDPMGDDWGAAVAAFTNTLKYAGYEEVIGGGPEDPAADVAAVATVAVGAVYSIVQWAMPSIHPLTPAPATPKPAQPVQPATNTSQAKTETKQNTSSGTAAQYFPNKALPRDKNGNAVPSSTHPHTQLGTKQGRKGSYPQSREWGKSKNGELTPKKDIDWTDHGRPSEHTNPHEHEYTPNQTGGTPTRGDGKPVQTTQ
jgi:RHS repeat-associated protein